MLSTTLPPTQAPGDGRGSADYEGFMACYLASYNAAGSNARVVQSYTRAYGFNSIHRFARSGTVPSFVVFKYVDGDNRRFVVGIEGVSSTAGVIDIARYGGAQAVAAQAGRVLAVFKDGATAIKAAILGAGIVDTQPGGLEDWQIFGFSMGAGIAEVMATQMGTVGVNNTRRTVTCTKFGSPRVGNAAWNAYLASRNDISVFNYYVVGDPIYNYPREMPNTAYTVATNFGTIWTWFELPDNLSVRDFYTGNSRARQLDNPADALRFLNELNGAINAPPNPWYWHSMISYRCMLLNRLAGGTIDLDYYRMRYLEHENENNFQVVWTRGLPIRATNLLNLDPVPADTVVPNSLLPRAVPAPTELPAWQGDWGENADAAVAARPGGTSAGGDWGFVPGTAPARRAGRLLGR